MSSYLTRVVRREIATHVIFEDRNWMAILEPRPLNPGHTVLFPKKETDYIFDLSERDLATMMRTAKKIAAAIRRAVPCLKIAVLVYGLKVRHAHMHLVPVHGKKGELDLSRTRKAADTATLEKIARRVRPRRSVLLSTAPLDSPTAKNRAR